MEIKKSLTAGIKKFIKPTKLDHIPFTCIPFNSCPYSFIYNFNTSLLLNLQPFNPQVYHFLLTDRLTLLIVEDYQKNTLYHLKEVLVEELRRDFK